MPTAEPIQPMPKRIVICLDGTWNSPAKESERDEGDKVFKPSNVLKTGRAIKGLDDCTGTLLFTGQPNDGETVTIDGKRYVFRTTSTPAEGDVLIGKDYKTSLANLRDAINAKRSTKPPYGAATSRHPCAEARAVVGNRSLLELCSRTPGQQGDPFAVAIGLKNGRWSSKQDLAARARARNFDPTFGIPQIAYYDIGVGALRSFAGGWNRFHRLVDKTFGGARGAGFEGNIEDAYGFLCLNHHPGDEIYLFGFSRGAASARGLSQFIGWMGGFLPRCDAYWIPRYFDAFLAGENLASTRKEIYDDLVRIELTRGAALKDAQNKAETTRGTITPATIRFLGVWDTVLSLGGDRDRLHVKSQPAACVEHVRQALSIDERRLDFTPRIWERPAHENQTLQQRWFAGVHTNVGGGYVDDGLANITLRWILDEARSAGLGLDDSFLKHYPAHSRDRLYSSYKGMYKILDNVRFKKGIRRIYVSEEAGLTIHPSVFERLDSTQEDVRNFPEFEIYRPKNLLRFLAEQTDLTGFLAGIPGLGEKLERIERIRQAVEAR